MNERTGGTAYDRAVRVRATRGYSTVLETFAMEVAGKDGGFHALEGTLVIRLDERLQVRKCFGVAWVVGKDVRDL